MQSRQEVVGVESAPERAAGEKFVDEGDAATRIVAFLERIKIVSGSTS